MAGPELSEGRGVPWENARGQAAASPPPRTGRDAPELHSLNVTPLGIFKKGRWCRTGWSASTFRHKWSVWCVRRFVPAPMRETTVAGMCHPTSGLVLCLCLVCSVRMLIDLTSQSSSFFL